MKHYLTEDKVRTFSSIDIQNLYQNIPMLQNFLKFLKIFQKFSIIYFTSLLKRTIFLLMDLKRSFYKGNKNYC